jgi:hypothetical protein
MKRQQYILILILLIVLIWATLFLRNMVITFIIIPTEQVVWALSTLFTTIPDVVWWGILIIVLIINIIREYGRISNNLETTAMDTKKPLYLIFPWNVQHNRSSINAYQRWKLEQRVSELAIEILAEINRTSKEISKKNILEGKYDLPSEVYKFIQTGLNPDQYNPSRKSIPFFQRKRLASHDDNGLEQTLDFLETRRI